MKICNLLVSLALFGSLAGCSEKESKPEEKKPSTTGNGDNAGDDDDDDDDDTDDAPADVDLCDDALKKASLGSTFSSDVSSFCSDYKSKAEESGVTYDQGDFDGNDLASDKGKIKAFEVKTEGNIVSFVLLSTSILDAKPEDYFNLTKLRQLKPDVFGDSAKGGYAFSERTRVCNVSVSGDDQVEYDTDNNATGGDKLAFRAKAKLHTVKSGQIYVTTNYLTDDKDESLKTFRTFTIIVPSGSSKTLAYTYSYQEVDKTATGTPQEEGVYVDKAKTKLREELRNNFENAKDAEKAADLLDESSTPPTSCAYTP